MKLRTRTFLIIAPSIVLLALVSWLVSATAVMNQFVSLETQQMTANIERVEQAIELFLTQLEQNTTDWAQWDDTYQFMEDMNEEYITANYVYETLSAVQIAHVLLFDTNGQLVKGVQSDDETQSVSDAPEEVTQTLKALIQSAGSNNSAPPKSGFHLLANNQ